MYDVFISYASEDKQIAVALVKALKILNLNVWFDEHCIEIGDSIRLAIEDGLKNSKYIVVIISPTFKTYWTNLELDSALHIESSKNGKFILPVCHNMTEDKAGQLVTLVAGRKMISTTIGIKQLAQKIRSKVVSGSTKKCEVIPLLEDGIDTTFIPEMTIHEIADKLSTSNKSNYQAIGRELVKLLKISEEIPDVAIMQLGKTARLLMNDAYRVLYGDNQNNQSDNFKEMLGNIAHKHWENILNFTDLSSNSSNVIISYVVSNNELLLCTHSLKVLLNWYVTAIDNHIKQKKNLTLIQPGEFTVEDIHEIHNIEEKLFPPELISPVEIVLEWNDANPKTLIGVRDTFSGKLVGFFNALPVSEGLFKKIASGKYIDTHIPAEDIRQFDFDDFYKLYLCSFCVDKTYWNTNAFRMIIDAFINHLMKLAVEHNIFITEIIADAITPKGEELCKFAGMKKHKTSTHNSAIYKATLLPPSMRFINKNCQRLSDYYQKIYEQYKELL